LVQILKELALSSAVSRDRRSAVLSGILECPHYDEPEVTTREAFDTSFDCADFVEGTKSRTLRQKARKAAGNQV
jgi:hypothetical protein